MATSLKTAALGTVVLLWTLLTPAFGQTPPAQASPARPARTPAPEVHTPPPASDGKYEKITVHGYSLVGNLEGDSPDRQVSVYLPPSYEKDKTRRYPVLYLLHGFTDSDDHWFGLLGSHFVNVQGAVDRAYKKGAHEMIIVMPNAYTKYAGSMYSNSAVTGDWELFIVQDLVNYIDGHYRTLAQRASRGLAGHSMGGYGTMRFGMKFPKVFSSLYAMSPCCMDANISPNAETMDRVAKMNTPAEIAAADFGTKAMAASAAAWSPNPKNPPKYFDLPVVDGKVVPQVVATWAANAPLAMVNQYITNLRMYDAIAFDAGDRDKGIAETVRALDRILNGYSLKHTFEIYDGDHVSAINERLATKVLPFFSEHLKDK
ncbi:MAG TPA: alpha/beta fold hydrolase [Steroidobacteraceae bacterium]|jgi:enterochelin esterase-like enzyme